MDEMHIGDNGLVKKILPKILRSYIYKKFGYETNVVVNKIDVVMDGAKTHIHIDVDGDLETRDLLSLIFNEHG